MKAERGFTLVEVLAALVLTGVVALLVYGAAGAALETERRLDEGRIRRQEARAWRALVTDALRNARPARIRGDTAFWVDDGRGPDGTPADRLRFLTAGGLAPLTPDADWLVSIEPVGNGLVLTAAAVGVVGPPRLVRGPAGVRGLDVRVTGFTRELEWTARWRFPALVPGGVELVWWTASGAADTLRLTVPLGGLQ